VIFVAKSMCVCVLLCPGVELCDIVGFAGSARKT